MSEPTPEGRWLKTERLAGIVVGMAIIAGLALAGLAGATAAEAGFPLAHILTTLALSVVPAALVFWYADRQEAIDRPHGLYED
ncbi:MAG TPA: hypothetical protein PKA74_01365 [Bauldia sp.]|nr:hypothetical protein [Bauldia sp.]